MRKHTIEVYKFNELNQEAQERAIQDHIENIDWSIESEDISEIFKDELSKLGLPNETVEWSLNYSQGDGVAFYGGVYSEEDIKTLAKTILSEVDANFLIEMLNEVKLEFDVVKNSYGNYYNHYNTMNVEMTFDSYSDRIDVDGFYDYANVDKELSERVVRVVNDLYEGLKDYIKQVSKNLEKEGYSMIEAISSEENAREYLEDTDREFHESGKLFVG